ncbi:MAG: hypothetical protein ACRDS9_13045 [Pseudonocardiaceae bacterium]
MRHDDVVGSVAGVRVESQDQKYADNKTHELREGERRYQDRRNCHEGIGEDQSHGTSCGDDPAHDLGGRGGTDRDERARELGEKPMGKKRVHTEYIDAIRSISQY